MAQAQVATPLLQPASAQSARRVNGAPRLQLLLMPCYGRPALSGEACWR